MFEYYFGMPVDVSNGVNCCRLLVGAPEAQTSQQDVVRGGAVFKCSITQADVCEEVVFDAKGSFRNVHSSHLPSAKCPSSISKYIISQLNIDL